MKTFRFLFFLSAVLGFIFFDAPKELDLDLSVYPAFLSPLHPLGCDKLGRDIYALYSYGVLSAFVLAIPARVVTIFVSLLLSLFYRFLNRPLKMLFNSIATVFLSLPSLLVALVILYSLGASFGVFILSILLSDWAIVYESISGKIREVESAPYVLASGAMGAGRFYLFKEHIFPELFSIVHVLFITGVPGVIMTIAIFSYLGVDFGSSFFGPGLGEQIAFSRDYFRETPLAVFVPIIGIFLSVLSLSKIK